MRCCDDDSPDHFQHVGDATPRSRGLSCQLLLPNVQDRLLRTRTTTNGMQKTPVPYAMCQMSTVYVSLNRFISSAAAWHHLNGSQQSRPDISVKAIFICWSSCAALAESVGIQSAWLQPVSVSSSGPLANLLPNRPELITGKSIFRTGKVAKQKVLTLPDHFPKCISQPCSQLTPSESAYSRRL